MDNNNSNDPAADADVLKRHAAIVSNPDRHAKAQAKLQQDAVLHQRAIQIGAQHMHQKVRKGLRAAFPGPGDGPTPFQAAAGDASSDDGEKN